MRNSRWLTLLLVLVSAPASAAIITIEPVAVSLNTGRDPVPGRDPGFVFRGLSDVAAPAINGSGDVVFSAFSSSQSSTNTGTAFGIYLHEAGQPLRVLVDTTDDGAGNPTFPVPGQPAGTQFLTSLFGAPLINDAGDVVFFARFHDSAAATTGEGFYATNTALGSPLVKIVDNTDAVPGHLAGQFFDFRFVAPNPSRMAISLNDNGEVVYWAEFCLEATCTSTNMKNGLFGATVAGGSGSLLVDSTQTICPTGIPFGLTCDPVLDEGFWEIRPEKGITNTGDVIFHGKIRKGGSSCCAGVFSIPVTGGTITTAAFRTQPAPPDGTSIYSDRFDEVAHNEAGTVLFLPRLGFGSPARFGVFAGDLTGGPHVRIADTVPGTGPAVPGDPPDGEFTSVTLPTMNDAGQLGFRATSSNSVELNNDGIYAADTSGGPIRLVLDKLSQAPGLPDPARVTTFQESTGAAINSAGNMAFAGAGIDHLGNALRGIYFYDACAEEVTRIADSTTSLADLGGNFTSGTQEFEVYVRGEARAGQYRSMNDNNQVAFLAQFSNSDFGIYVANVQLTGGGSRPAVFVDAAATGANNGRNWVDAYTSLQDALLDAASPTCPASAVWVAGGTYKPDQGANQTAGDRFETFQMLNGVAILGGFTGNEDPSTFDLTTRDFIANETLLSGDLFGDDGPGFANNADNSLHVVTATGTDDTARLDGFTITGGNADGSSNDRFGGGLLNTRISGPTPTSGPTIAHCVIRENTAQFGGGVMNINGSTITLTDCTILGNLGAQQGGGMYQSSGVFPIIKNCLFAGNSSVTGGGLYVNQIATVTNCAFTGNVAFDVPSTSTGVGGGGGIFTIAVRDSFFLSNSSFSGNVAKRGAGLHNSFGGPLNRPRVHNCVFWDDSASVEGNEIFNFGSTAFVQNCDIQGSGGSGAGWDSTVGRDDGGNIDADPRFEDADGADNVTGTADDNLRLSCGSPAIDAGDDTLVPSIATTDLDGQPRIAGTAVNMGAFESQPTGTGQITITCPADLTLATALECGADTSPAATGTATAVEDCLGASVPTTFTDVSVPSCGGTETITRTWTADDGGSTASCVQTISTIDTSAPTISNLDGAPLLVPIGDPVILTATFADTCAGALTATWDLGDTTIVVTDPATSPTSVIHSYATQDIYTVTVTISDGCGNTTTDEIVVVAFDPNDGFTTGGGWFIPDADSFIDGTPVTNTTAKANFGFVVKYHQGSNTTSGSLEFVYKSGDINLHSLDMDWLVITSNTKVRFKGLATINGEGEYTFKVTGEDNGSPGSNDTFKIEIWLGVVDTENGPPTPKHKAQGVLGGGNIKVHN